MISLLRYNQITRDYVLDEINKLRKEFKADQKELQRVKETHTKLSYIADAELKLVSHTY